MPTWQMNSARYVLSSCDAQVSGVALAHGGNGWLKAAGIAIRRERGRQPPAKPASQAITDLGPPADGTPGSPEGAAPPPPPIPQPSTCEPLPGNHGDSENRGVASAPTI